MFRVESVVDAFERVLAIAIENERWSASPRIPID